MKDQKNYSGPLEDNIDKWFVNRNQELEMLWKWGSGIPHPGRNSYALIGLRRTGKTTIIHKLFNRLFYEQKKVMPVYISFARFLKREQVIDSYEFVDEYIGGYLRSYLAFRHNMPELFDDDVDLDYYETLAKDCSDEVLDHLFKRYHSARFGRLSSVYQLVHWAIDTPKGIARQYNIPTALIIDEFQILTNVYNPDSKVYNDVTNGFQHASETRWAPLLVSGSSVSMMVEDALGGMLSGRFQPWYLGPLSEEHTIDMIVRLAKVQSIPMNRKLALAIWELTKGYPYAVESILLSSCPAMEKLPDVEALKEILPYELTNRRGRLWSHYHREYGKYISQVNGDDVTRKVLLWLTKFTEKDIYADVVAQELNLDEKAVRECLERLYEADIIQSQMGMLYEGLSDPALRHYIRYRHNREMERLGVEEADADLQKEINRVIGKMNYMVGHFVEFIVAGVMQNNFDDRQVDGETYFGIPGQAKLHRFKQTQRREGVVKEGEVKEVDVVGEYTVYHNSELEKGAWLVSVRYRKRKMNEKDVQQFIEQTAALEKERGYLEIVRWYFSKHGFTKKGKAALEEAGIYHSDLEQFNALSAIYGLQPLIDLE